MLHFYEGQVRKFLTQFIRILSNFAEIDKKTRLTIAKNVKALVEEKFQIAAEEMKIDDNQTTFKKTNHQNQKKKIYISKTKKTPHPNKKTPKQKKKRNKT